MERNYPTRMHEILGVEAFEPFQIKGVYGHFFLTAAGDICSKEAGMDNNYLLYAINHGINRRPRLSEEHVKQLKALYKAFGVRYAHNPENADCMVVFSIEPLMAKECAEDDYKTYIERWGEESLKNR